MGLEIDRRAIKAVQVSQSGESYTLQHVGYRRLPAGAITEGEVADHDLLASELKEFWTTHSFKGKTVYLGVANQKVVVRLLDFPRMSPEDLRGAIGFEVQDHIPMPLEEAVIDFLVLGSQSEGSDLDRILLVAAQKEMISRYSSAVRAAGLRPLSVDVKALSLIRSTLPNTLFEDEGAVLLLDVSTETTNLVVTQGGNPTLARFIPGGSGYLAQAIAEAADLPEEEAERQLMNPKVKIGPEAEEEEVSAAEEDDDYFDPALAYDIRRGLEPYGDLQVRLNAKKPIADGIVRTRFLWDQFLLDLSFLIPESTALTSFVGQATPINIRAETGGAPGVQNLEPIGSIIFSGVALPEHQNISDFIVRMNNMRFLANADLTRAELDRETFAEPAITFEVSSNLITRVGEGGEEVPLGNEDDEEGVYDEVGPRGEQASRPAWSSGSGKR